MQPVPSADGDSGGRAYTISLETVNKWNIHKPIRYKLYANDGEHFFVFSIKKKYFVSIFSVDNNRSVGHINMGTGDVFEICRKFVDRYGLLAICRRKRVWTNFLETNTNPSGYADAFHSPVGRVARRKSR
jgi:hypothetical protein